MARRIIISCIGAGLLVVLAAVVWPALAQRLLQRTVSGVAILEKQRTGLMDNAPAIKVVDPASLANAIDRTSPLIKAIFQKASPADGELVIEDIIDATNRERIAAGVQPLQVNPLLTTSAQLKTEDMITNNYFEHTSPTGVTVSDLGTRVGYQYVIIGENLALGNFTDANDLVQAWMASPAHRANMLNPQYQDIGIYAAKGMYEGHEVWFAVQHFGTSRSVCPSIDADLKQRIDLINNNLTSQRATIETMKGELENTNPRSSGYNDEVNKFNALVNGYNNDLATSRGLIEQYNQQVRDFNDCLATYQK